MSCSMPIPINKRQVSNDIFEAISESYSIYKLQTKTVDVDSIKQHCLKDIWMNIEGL